MAAYFLVACLTIFSVVELICWRSPLIQDRAPFFGPCNPHPLFSIFVFSPGFTFFPNLERTFKFRFLLKLEPKGAPFKPLKIRL